MSSEYSAGASWPLDEKYVSAFGAPLFASVSSSVHSHVMMSVELKLDPMWPDPAFMIMYSVLMRHTSARISARAIRSVTSARTRRIAASGTNVSVPSPTSCLSE